jgi:hypothetical protein
MERKPDWNVFLNMAPDKRATKPHSTHDPHKKLPTTAAPYSLPLNTKGQRTRRAAERREREREKEREKCDEKERARKNRARGC